jgi:hypothetical protein
MRKFNRLELKLFWAAIGACLINLIAFSNRGVMRMSEQSIIQHLDSWMNLDNEPVLLNHINYELADARLSAFRSKYYWVIVFETIVWDIPASQYMRQTYIYGNCIREQGHLGYDILLTEEDILFKFNNNEKLFISFLWDRRKYELQILLDDYISIGLQSDIDHIEEEMIEPHQLLRLLCYRLNHPFFASEKEMRMFIAEVSEQLVSDSLQLIWQTYEWQHPNAAFDELPSQTEFFPLLAEALITGDLSGLRQFDISKCNSHWSNWTKVDRKRNSISPCTLTVDKVEGAVVREWEIGQPD